MIKLKDIFTAMYANIKIVPKNASVEQFTEYKIELAGDKTYQVDYLDIDNNNHTITLYFNE